jgi:aryl-alcohol dehydrogenase-like predicted oxidoreductase
MNWRTKLNYTHLGRTGLRVSRLCLGCMSFGTSGQGPHEWTLDEEASRPFFRQALEAGINFFDTANMYSAGSSEEITGRALREFALRDEIVVATKAFGPWRGAPNTGGLSRKALLQAIDDSLARLGMDYVDLFQIHRFDHDTPVEETMEALHDIVKAGKARYIGASSMEAWRFAKMQQVAKENGWSRFVSMQPQVNLVYREEEREMIPLCQDQGVGVIPWSPLARGMLTRDWDEKTARSQSDQFGRMLYGATEAQDRKVVETVAAIASDRGVPRAQVALAWLVGKPGITAPIVGATKPNHLEDAVAALDLALTDDEVRRLEESYVPHPVVGLSFPNSFEGKISVLPES